jgi:hypothetical protein
MLTSPFSVAILIGAICVQAVHAAEKPRALVVDDLSALKDGKRLAFLSTGAGLGKGVNPDTANDPEAVDQLWLG